MFSGSNKPKAGRRRTNRFQQLDCRYNLITCDTMRYLSDFALLPTLYLLTIVFCTFFIYSSCEKISYDESKSWRPSTAGNSINHKERRSAFVINPHFEVPPSDLNDKIVPCDITNEIAGACSTPGEHYPWHKLQSFVRDNQAMMKRMYGADFLTNSIMESSKARSAPHLRAQGPVVSDESRSAFARSAGGGGPGGSSVVNACPSEQFVITPFWANNSDGETVAVVNFHPFEQAVQQEVCKPGIQGRCRDGCVCEQKFAWYRLLAFDPKDDCRGIFMDWFQFPSCCACRCYQLPIAEKSAIFGIGDESQQQTSAATTKQSIPQDDEMPTITPSPSVSSTQRYESPSTITTGSSTSTTAIPHYAAVADNEVYYHPSTPTPSATTSAGNTLVERQHQAVASADETPHNSQSYSTLSSITRSAAASTTAAPDTQQQLHLLLTETAAALRRNSAVQVKPTPIPNAVENGRFSESDAAAHQIADVLTTTRKEQHKQQNFVNTAGAAAAQNVSTLPSTLTTLPSRSTTTTQQPSTTNVTSASPRDSSATTRTTTNTRKVTTEAALAYDELDDNAVTPTPFESTTLPDTLSSNTNLRANPEDSDANDHNVTDLTPEDIDSEPIQALQLVLTPDFINNTALNNSNAAALSDEENVVAIANTSSNTSWTDASDEIAASAINVTENESSEPAITSTTQISVKNETSTPFVSSSTLPPPSTVTSSKDIAKVEEALRQLRLLRSNKILRGSLTSSFLNRAGQPPTEGEPTLEHVERWRNRSPRYDDSYEAYILTPLEHPQQEPLAA